MLNSFSIAQIEVFKREAKQLCRTTPITHSQALDRIADANGYDNWSLLMRRSNPTQVSHAAPSREMLVVERNDLIFTRTPDEIRTALRVISVPRYSMTSRMDEALRQTDDICFKFASADNAVNFAADYVASLLKVPRFKIYSATTVYMEMRRWLPYCVHEVKGDVRILVNRRYKPVGLLNDDWAQYSEFQHLHVSLGDKQLEAFAHRGSSPGYLFNDGCPPWSSRTDAENYLNRLRILQATLKG